MGLLLKVRRSNLLADVKCKLMNLWYILVRWLVRVLKLYKLWLLLPTRMVNLQLLDSVYLFTVIMTFIISVRTVLLMTLCKNRWNKVVWHLVRFLVRKVLRWWMVSWLSLVKLRAILVRNLVNLVTALITCCRRPMTLMSSLRWNLGLIITRRMLLALIPNAV